MRLNNGTNVNSQASSGFNDSSSAKSSVSGSNSSVSRSSSNSPTPLLDKSNRSSIESEKSWKEDSHPWDLPVNNNQKTWSNNDLEVAPVGILNVPDRRQDLELFNTHQLGYVDGNNKSKSRKVIFLDHKGVESEKLKGASSAARVWVLVPKNSDGELKALNESDANRLKGSKLSVIRDGKRVELTGRITVMTEEERKEVKEKVDLIYEQVMVASKEKGLEKEVKEGDKKSYSNQSSERTPSEMQFLKIINELGQRERKAIDRRGIAAEENKIDEHKREEKREFDKTMTKMLNVSMERNFAAKEENQNEVDTSVQMNKSNQAEVDDTREGTPLKRQGMVDDGSPNPPARRARPTRLGGPAH